MLRSVFVSIVLVVAASGCNQGGEGGSAQQGQLINSASASPSTVQATGVYAWEVYRAGDASLRIVGRGVDGAERFVEQFARAAGTGDTTLTVSTPVRYEVRIAHDGSPTVLAGEETPALKALQSRLQADLGAGSGIRVASSGNVCVECAYDVGACGGGTLLCAGCPEDVVGCLGCLTLIKDCPDAQRDCYCCMFGWSPYGC